MKRCYLCNTPLTNENKSEEHIIPNCIGGRLKSWNLLCKTCNNKLGKTVDSDFSKIFLPITTQLHIDKERGINQPVSAMMTLKNGDVIDVLYTNHKATPQNPCHIYDDEKKKVTIYGNKKTTKMYEKKVIKELEANNKSQHSIEHCDNIFGEMLIKFNLENEAFQIQLNKIGTSFAIHNGVKASDIMHIDIDNSKIRPKNCIPYYPQGALAPIIEENRTLIDPNYPSHSLVLFTYEISNSHKQLWCYIELFSTFQFYTILNDNYSGEHIYKSYQQKLFTSNNRNSPNYHITEYAKQEIFRQYGVEENQSLNSIQKAKSYELNYMQTTNELIYRALDIMCKQDFDIHKVSHIRTEYQQILKYKTYNYLRISHLERLSDPLLQGSAHKCKRMFEIRDPKFIEYGYKKFNMLHQFALNKHLNEVVMNNY